MKSHRHESGRRRAVLTPVILLLALWFGARPAICGTGGVWPRTSNKKVAPLSHPTIETELERRGGAPSTYRFAVFGDQRALADGEWQLVVGHIARISEDDRDLLFVLDTGDIVNDGSHSDQFWALTDILKPLSRLPYMVGVGNHEKTDNKRHEALLNTAEYLSYLDPGFCPERMYYSKDIGSARFLFLDTNDLVYGIEGDGDEEVGEPRSGADEQMAWLVDELAACARDGVRTTIAVMHHPIVQSSTKHRKQAAALWNLEYGGESLVELLFNGGVDLILAGHTHTYERFVISDANGRKMGLVNISGRPRGGPRWLERVGSLWAGAVSRRAVRIAGREASWLAGSGWNLPGGWSVLQAEAMTERQADQFGIVTVEQDGGILLDMAFLDRREPGGLRWSPAVRIK